MSTHREPSNARRDSRVLLWGLVALVVLAAGAVVAYGSWFAARPGDEGPESVAQAPLLAAAQPVIRVVETANDEKRRLLTDDQMFTGDSRRIELGPQHADAMRANDVWTVAVRAEDAGGAPLEFESGSVSFMVLGRDGQPRALRREVECGLWSSALPIDGKELVWFQFSSARLDGRRFVPSARHDPFEPRFDGTDVLVLEPAPDTLVCVIDPRTGELAEEAELLVSTTEAAELGYRFSFSVTARGEPVRIDELHVHDLEDVPEVEVRASIAGVGEATRIVELASGQSWELRPLNRGSARITWHPAAGLSTRKPELIVRPVRLAVELPQGSWETTRTKRLGASFFEGRDRDASQEINDVPWTELFEGLPDGEYLALITAELQASTGRLTIGSTGFVVTSGSLTEVVVRTEPGPSDRWRLLRVELELPPGFEGRELAASLVPVGLGARSRSNFMPLAARRTRFATALVLAGRHEFLLSEPLPFAATLDVSDVPEHVARVVVPPPLEHRIHFRVGEQGLKLPRIPRGVVWRTRTGTALDATEHAASAEHDSVDGALRILAPGAIELRLESDCPLALARGEWAALEAGGEHEVHVRARPQLELNLSAPAGVDRVRGVVAPWVLQRETGAWTRLNGFWIANDERAGHRFHSWLPFEGEFELELRCGDEFLPLQRRSGTLEFDETATFEFELLRAH